MIRIQTTLDIDILYAYRDLFSRLPKFAPKAFNRQLTKSKQKLERKLRVAPNALPNLPFIWSYDPVKQNRALRWYFANKVPKGSKGGRYKRTGKLLRAWEIKSIITPDSVTVTAQNNAPGADYVIGDRQVPTHYETGWGQQDEILQRWSVELQDDMIEMWYTITDPFAGVRG